MHRALCGARLGRMTAIAVTSVDIAQDRARFRKDQIAIDDEGRLAQRMDMLEIFGRASANPGVALQLVFEIKLFQ